MKRKGEEEEVKGDEPPLYIYIYGLDSPLGVHALKKLNALAEFEHSG